MPERWLIQGAWIVNEGRIEEKDVLIVPPYIEKVAEGISAKGAKEVKAKGWYLLPGAIDVHVHFREPGLTHKGSIATESKAAIAGGVTSYIEMPNTQPPTTTIEQIQKKCHIAAKQSWANYAFYLGASKEHAEEIKKIDPKKVAGIKIFMGSSTGNLLIEEEEWLCYFFEHTPVPITIHCEWEARLRERQHVFKQRYPNATAAIHPEIRDRTACLIATEKAVSLAKTYKTPLHILHITTKEECHYLEKHCKEAPWITAEACIPHLFFDASHYQTYGNFIKVNPAIKGREDRQALWKALQKDVLSIISTDHAPHLWSEKQQPYYQAPSGMPSIRFFLPLLLDAVLRQQRLSLTQLVEKIAHFPAKRFQIAKRGFIKEGYFADLVLINPIQGTHPRKVALYYRCGWTPFKTALQGAVAAVMVNGQWTLFNGRWNKPSAMPLEFQR